MSELVRYKSTATGHVQGVGLRQFANTHAFQDHVSGWIRNMEDGSVQMEYQGTEADVNKFITDIRGGNYYIKIDHMTIDKIPVVPDEKDFKIRF